MAETTAGLTRKQAKAACIEARALGLKTFAGVTCPQGHSERLTSNGNCVQCQRASVLRWAKDNPDRQRLRAKRFADRHRDKERERNRSWYQANADRQRQRGREKYWRDPAKAAEAYRTWADNNSATVRAYERARRHAKINRTPLWLSEGQRAQMREVYALARECSMLTGDPYHVDHIVPLRGKTVCGLHVPWNLQVLPGAINASKGARFDGGWAALGEEADTRRPQY